MPLDQITLIRLQPATGIRLVAYMPQSRKAAIDTNGTSAISCNAGVIPAGSIGATLADNQLQQGNFANLRMVESYRPMVSSAVGFGVRKSDGELLRKINTSLAKLQANGTVKKIRASYGL
jgi:ABC-type amino acid transport substrate-binding protein